MQTERGRAQILTLTEDSKKITITINKTKIPMIIDSGATCNIINSKIRQTLQADGIKFHKSHRTIQPYCSDPIKASVQADVKLNYEDRATTAQLICIEGTAPALLGRNTAEMLNVLNIENVSLCTDQIVNLESSFQGLTKGIGKLLKLHYRSTYRPIRTPRRQKANPSPVPPP